MWWCQKWFFKNKNILFWYISKWKVLWNTHRYNNSKYDGMILKLIYIFPNIKKINENIFLSVLSIFPVHECTFRLYEAVFHHLSIHIMEGSFQLKISFFFFFSKQGTYGWICDWSAFLFLRRKKYRGWH